MEMEEEQYEENYEDVCKDYIRNKYVEDGVIASELYEQYSKIPKEEIDEIIRKKCYEEQVLYRIERPVERKEIKSESMYQTKTLIKEVDKLPEGIKEGVEQITYENLPYVCILRIPYVQQLARLEICFWKSTEVLLIERVLCNIPVLYDEKHKIKNFEICRGYFCNQYVNTIILPIVQSYYYEKKIKEGMTEEGIKERKLGANEIGALIDIICDRLIQFKPECLNKMRYILVDEIGWAQLRIFGRRIEFKRGQSDKCFIPIKGRDGIIFEKSKNITAPGLITLQKGSDIVNKVNFEVYGLMNITARQPLVRDFKTPIIKRVTVYYLRESQIELTRNEPNKKEIEVKPRKVFRPITFNRAIVAHIMKWMRTKHDVDNLTHVFPSVLYNKINTRTENKEAKYRVEAIENILDELENHK